MKNKLCVSPDILVDIPTSWDDVLITERTLAKRWGISVKALQKARLTKMGITVPYHKFSNLVRYKFSDVIAYEQASKVTSNDGGAS